MIVVSKLMKTSFDDDRIFGMNIATNESMRLSSLTSNGLDRTLVDDGRYQCCRDPISLK